MENQKKDNRDINNKQDEVSAQRADVHDTKMPSDDGFKTGKKSHGLTWETPMDEQAFDSEDLSREKQDEEGD